jgi:hypothetical protein
VRFRRALGPLVLSLASLVAVLAPGGAALRADAAAGGSVTVGLSSLSPTVAAHGDTVKLKGSLVGSSAAHAGVTVRLAVAEMVGRSAMANNAGSHSQLVYGYQDSVGDVAAGATVPWSLSVPVSAMDLNGRGVYALDVEAYSDDARIGALRTYLPYDMSSDSSLKPTQMVLVWPVTGEPALDGQVGNDVPEAANDQLSGQFAANGRLSRVLTSAAAAAAAPHKVTVSWLVDPDLLATAANEQSGYTLYSNGTTGSATSTASGAQNAQRWLTEAKTVLGAPGEELWQLPATDPDLGSLSTTDSAFAQEAIKTATLLSGSTVADDIGRTPQGTVAWPADGQADAPTLQLAAQLDPAATIVDSDSIGLHTHADVYTPTGRVNSGGNRLAVSDSDLDAIFAGDAADAGYSGAGTDTSLLASQRFLAQSALIALEYPNLSPPRTVLVTAPRGVQPNDALLGAVGQAGWIRTVGLSTLINASPDSQAQTTAPKRDAGTVKTDLTADQLTDSEVLSSSVQSLAEILSDPTKVTEPYNPAALRTVSTSWRGDTDGQTAFAGSVQAHVSAIVDAVHLVQKSDLTLSGKSGVIPFTIQNQLNEPVNVGIRITTDRAGLSVQQVQVRQVQPGSTTVEVHVNSAVSGQRVTVSAQLVTPTGSTYGDTQSLQVSVSSIGSVTLVIFGLSAALLVVAVMLRIYRSRRTRSAALATELPGTPADNVASVEAERGQ